MHHFHLKVCIASTAVFLLASSKSIYIPYINDTLTQVVSSDQSIDTLHIRFSTANEKTTFTAENRELTKFEVSSKNLLGGASLRIDNYSESNCVSVLWETETWDFNLQDCIVIDDSEFWIAGQQMYNSFYASNSTFGTDYEMQPFASNDIYKDNDKLGGVLEPIWISSNGWYVEAIISNKSTTIPLWVSFKVNNITSNKEICLKSAWGGLYGKRRKTDLTLKYKLCKYRTIFEAWTVQIKSRQRNIQSSPNVELLQEPVWSTWANFKKDVNQSAVLEFAETIKNEGYPYSTIEIDDMWSRAYGDLIFDPIKFPNPSLMINTLHKMDFKVMVWVTPFFDVNAEVYDEGARNNYWVMKQTKNSSLTPALVNWWNNNGSGSAVLDVTNPVAVKWFINRLRLMQPTLGIDGFKLDAGEVTYIPLPSSDSNIKYHNILALGNGSQLVEYTRLYSEIVNSLPDFSEVRAAYNHQSTDQYVRIMDLDSRWGSDNGLRAMIPRVLLFGTLGYRYVLPDMIGGNGYGANGELFVKEIPPPELYIRWLQANCLMPMQLSIPPWRYAGTPYYEQVKRVAKRVFVIRKKLNALLLNAIDDAKHLSLPIVRPMWMINTTYQSSSLSRITSSQYMLGECVVCVEPCDFITSLSNGMNTGIAY